MARKALVCFVTVAVMALVLSFPASAVGDMTDGLISYWSLEESGGPRSDAHGANDLTDNNTVGSVSGKVGNAAMCQVANSEWLNITDNASFSVSKVSLSAWVYLTSLPSYVASIVSKYGSAGAREYQIVYDNTLNRFRFVVSADGTTTTAATGSVSVSTGQWYHIVAWADTGEVGIKVNAGTAATVPGSGIHNGSGDFAMCRPGSLPSNYFDGYIDEVGLWDRVLTSEEVDWLYNSGSGRSYSDILATQATPTPSPTPTDTPMPTDTPTPHPTLTPTPGPTATPTPTVTPGPTLPVTVYDVELPSGANAQIVMTATAGDLLETMIVAALLAVIGFDLLRRIAHMMAKR